jgi:ribosome-associated translation inhibitor RaiA
MSLPLQITFRHMDPSPALEARIRRKAAELEQVFNRITACRVVVESRHRHRHQGNLFEVRVDLSVPGSQLVAGRNHAFDHAHEDAHTAVRDAFEAARRQLEDHVRAVRDDAKHAGAVRQIVPTEPA